MKTIRKNLLLLAFAAGALFVIGNNVLAGGPDNPETEIIWLEGPVITCDRDPARGAQCWERVYVFFCRWTGSILNTC